MLPAGLPAHSLCIVTMDTEQKSLHLFQCPIPPVFSFLFLHFHSSFAFSKQPFCCVSFIFTFLFTFYSSLLRPPLPLLILKRKVERSWGVRMVFQSGRARMHDASWHSPFVFANGMSLFPDNALRLFFPLLFTFLLFFYIPFPCTVPPSVPPSLLRFHLTRIGGKFFTRKQKG